MFKKMIKRAVIVGASSGIGKGLAQLLVKEGYIVGITGRRVDMLNEIKQSNPESYVIKVFDLNDYEKVKDNLDGLLMELGEIDLFILSSGTGKRNPELELIHEINTSLTNVMGFTAAINWAYRYFEKRGGGKLAAISSIAGTRGFAMSPSYSASKSFQIKYLESLRQKSHGAGRKIIVSDIRPGFVDTDMGNGDGAFWIAPVEKASKQILRGIKKNRGVIFVTKRWILISFFLKLIPGFIYERIKP